MLDLLHDHLFDALWCLWLVYWLIAAFGGKAVQRRESFVSRVGHFGPLILAGYLLGADHLPGGFLCGRAWPSSEGVFWTGAGLLTAGLLFSVWARVHLGGNWSGSVTVKEDHELVRTGPYGLARHPIYTGLLLGFIGSALSRAEWRGVLAVLIVLAALWRKLRLEERWMGEVFGEAYADYKREVAA
ncbi:MAG TPA: isoprenylcysteine carboxylmethyltransferase family protein, partial [Holophagaceae bacterium]|nr:isoprenylcysteine carboxylmethyltransferase family protein [Holophagaceae bacterium]